MITNIFSNKLFFLFSFITLVNTQYSYLSNVLDNIKENTKKFKDINSIGDFKNSLKKDDKDSIDYPLLVKHFNKESFVSSELESNKKTQYLYINEFCTFHKGDINEMRKINKDVDFAIILAIQMITEGPDSTYYNFSDIDEKAISSIAEKYMNYKKKNPLLSLVFIHDNHKNAILRPRSFLDFSANHVTFFSMFFSMISLLLSPYITDKYQQWAFRRKITPVKSLVKWDDIKGLDDNIQKKLDIIALSIQKQKSTKQLKKFNHIIFCGPPGNGKTFIAQGFADSQKIPIYKLSSSTLLNNKESIEIVFQNIATYARKNKTPVILFLDEIDLLIPSRKSNNFTLEEKHQLQNFLSILDSEDLNGVLIIANTNFIENLDDAILRDGRFGNHIKFDNPDEKSIREIIKGMEEKYKISFSENFDHQVLLNHLKGKSISSVENIFRNIALLKFKNQLSVVDNKLIEVCCY